METEMTAVEKIRAGYMPKEKTKIEELRALDKRVKRPAQIFAYVYGSVSALIMGTGMCLAMKVIGASLAFGMPLGIVVGLLGMGLAATTYPLYQKFLQKRKKKYANRIFELSDKISNE